MAREFPPGIEIEPALGPLEVADLLPSVAESGAALVVQAVEDRGYGSSGRGRNGRNTRPAIRPLGRYINGRRVS